MAEGRPVSEALSTKAQADHDTMLINRAVERGLIAAAVAVDVTQRTLNGARASDVLVNEGHLTQKLVERLLHEPNAIPQLSTGITQFDLGLVQIPGYSVTSVLGRGGMGVVFAATQESLGRSVALKVIIGDMAKDSEFAERFLREARAAGAVNHPNVITCYDVGRISDRLYMALELATGGDAHALQRARGGRLSESKVLRIGCDCARGLVAIARAGLIHRDIKPSNIFISDDGAAKLADLGLARSTTGDDRMTVTGRAMGTPAFMSPEQARGERDINIASDIYALGATLFCLVTGQPPYDGATPWVVVAKVLNDPVPDARAVAPELSPGLAMVLMRAMAKSVGDRYVTPDLFLGDLERLVAGLPPLLEHAVPGTATMRRAGGLGGAEGDSARVPTVSITHPVIPVKPRRHIFIVIVAALGIALVTIAVASVVMAERTKIPEAIVPPEAQSATTGSSATAVMPLAQPVSPAVAPPGKMAQPSPTMIALAKEFAARLRTAGQATAVVDPVVGDGLAVSGLTADFRDLTIFSGLPIHRLSLAGCRRITDLRPLAEVPIRALNLRGLDDLNDLRGIETMALTSLDLTGCSDLAGDLKLLDGKPITALTLTGCSTLNSISGIARLRLRSLDAAGCRNVRGDLLALHGMPLTVLNLSGCGRLTSLSGLEGVPLTVLNVSGCDQITNLQPLELGPISELDLSRCPGLTTAALTSVRKLPVQKLNLAGNIWVNNLTALSGARLTHLTLADCTELKGDLQALAGMPISELNLSRTAITTMAGLERAPLTLLTITGNRALTEVGLKPIMGRQVTIIR